MAAKKVGCSGTELASGLLSYAADSSSRREKETTTSCQTFLWQCHASGKEFACTGSASQVVKDATILTHGRAATLTFVLCRVFKGQGYYESLNLITRACAYLKKHSIVVEHCGDVIYGI